MAGTSLDRLREGGYGTIGNGDHPLSKELMEPIIRTGMNSILSPEWRKKRSDALFKILKEAMDKARAKQD